MKHMKKLICTVLVLTMLSSAFSAMACTVMAAGKDATADGSTMVTHTCDGQYDHRIQVIPGGKHADGEMVDIYRDPCYDSFEISTKIGEIPQVPETYTYFNVAYPFMNEKGVAIAEHTWVGRDEVYNGEGLFVIANLEMLGLQRGATAREVVQIMGALAEEYGYGDWGEGLVVADDQEVWVFEIVGPSVMWRKDSGKPGAHWAARRLPDDQIFAAANRSRLGVIDFNDPENYMWSTDITALPKEMGWWKEGEEFNFSMIFENNLSEDPGYMCSRREWRIFNLLAPEKGKDLPILDDATNHPYPFSMVPDKKVTVQDLMAVYRDHYEGTPYDLSTDAAAGPFHNPTRWSVRYDQMPEEVSNWNYDWERSIAIYRCSYSFVAQCRDWLPDEIGTVLWYGADSPDTTVRVPLYAGTTDVPEAWRNGNRTTFDMNSAWWAFNFVHNWANLRWDAMYKEIDARRAQLEGEFFDNQEKFEAEAKALLEKDPAAGREFVTKYVNDGMNHVAEEWWKFAGELVGMYSDGDKMSDAGHETLGFPMEYLEQVGYAKSFLNDHKKLVGEAVDTEEPAEEAEKPAEETEKPAEEPAEKPAETSSGITVPGVVLGLVIGAAAALLVVFLMRKKNTKK